MIKGTAYAAARQVVERTVVPAARTGYGAEPSTARQQLGVITQWATGFKPHALQTLASITQVARGTRT